MGNNHFFNKETDSEKLAMEIVAYLRKWGMWQDVQIFTGGKCYTDENGELVIRDEEHPEKYTRGINCYNDCNSDAVFEDYSNPERLLDMTFEGPLHQLIRYGEYEVKLKDVSNEIRHILLNKAYVFLDEADALMDEYIQADCLKISENHSNEEWLELNEYSDLDSYVAANSTYGDKKNEFSSREEYEVFLMCQACEREELIEKYYTDEICDDSEWDYLWKNESFFDGGSIANMVIEEFNNLLKKYGLWYERCFSWSLTTYRQSF